MNRVNDSNRRLIFAVTGTIPSGTVYNGVTINRSNPQQSEFFDPDIHDGSAQRSMLGVTASGNIIFLAADSGRTTSTGRGVRGRLSVDAGAEILRNMGAVTILNLDGGGSTQMFCRDNGRVIHPPFDLSDPRDDNSPPVYRIIGSVFSVW